MGGMKEGKCNVGGGMMNRLGELGFRMNRRRDEIGGGMCLQPHLPLKTHSPKTQNRHSNIFAGKFVP